MPLGATSGTLRGMSTTLQTAVEALIRKHDGLRAAARAIGIDAGYLSRLRTGKRTDPSDEQLFKLGLERRVIYRKILNGGPNG